MKCLTVALMRQYEARAIAEGGVTVTELMERAGAAAAAAALELAAAWRGTPRRALLVAGRGNNGGDALVAARRLAGLGWPVRVLLTGAAEELRGDARAACERLIAAGVQPVTPADWTRLDEPDEAFIVVDGVLGTGLTEAPRGAEAAAIVAINRLGARAPVLALDVPSGLNADTGLCPGEVVRADLTLAFGWPKIGLTRPDALTWLGAVEVADIGIPPEYAEGVASRPEIIARAEVRASFTRRAVAAHKGVFGHALLVGGAPGYAGALTLAARAALRAGAGLVSVLAPRSVAPQIAAGVPEAMVHPMPETPEGTLARNALQQWPRRVTEFDAVLVGPGLTTRDDGRWAVDHLLDQCRTPLVVDADALNLLAGRPDRLAKALCPLVMTPHPGEMARLMRLTVEEVQADRSVCARKAAAQTHAHVVLKGAGTLVAPPDDAGLRLNLRGNPGLATAGAGDALAGLLTGLLAQGLKPLAAASAAVYLHGLAGDLAAAALGQAAMTAGDVIERLPAALCRVQSR